MYIRKRPCKTKNGEARYSYGLVECRREAGMPKQRTILNLGRDFDVDPQDLPVLCAQTQARLIGKPMLPMHSGAYRATPVRRVENPKPDGSTRPPGITSIEDQIVQMALVKCIRYSVVGM